MATNYTLYLVTNSDILVMCIFIIDGDASPCIRFLLNVLDTCNLIVDLVMFSLEFLHLLDLILDQPVNLVPGQAQRIHSLKIHRTKAAIPTPNIMSI